MKKQNSRNNHKNKHKLKITISKISINMQNYKNNYLYLTLGCKGLVIKIQDIPQGSQYHVVVYQCLLYHDNLNIKLGS
jgi:hypothetical protein